MQMLNGATDAIATTNYPATTGDLIAAHGDVELELPNGTESLGAVLGRLTEETYQDESEARLAVYSAISTKGIGRVGYSDRDPGPPGAEGPDQVSL